MARKKIVFVIVEGPSDEDSLGAVLSQLYDHNTVFFHIVHGDITTERSVSVANILAKIGIVLRQYASSNHFRQTDFKEIIHLVDMDGAYVPDKCIILDDCEKPFYDLETIRTRNPGGISQRNIQKRSILDKLCATSSIWGIPYHVFYMSCNLDHVLHNKPNSTDIDKETDSLDFAKKYISDIPGFLTFICHSDFSVVSEYDESWRFIRQGTNSLHRHTNFGVFL